MSFTNQVRPWDLGTAEKQPILQATEDTSQLIPRGGQRHVTLEPVLGQTQKASSCKQRVRAAVAAGQAPGERRGGVYRAGLAGPTSVPRREAFGKTMPSAATPSHQPGALRAARRQPTARLLARSILGRLNPERCYCSSTGETERAKPRQQVIAARLHPSCGLRQTACTHRAKSPSVNLALRRLFSGNPGKKAIG